MVHGAEASKKPTQTHARNGVGLRWVPDGHLTCAALHRTKNPAAAPAHSSATESPA